MSEWRNEEKTPTCAEETLCSNMSADRSNENILASNGIHFFCHLTPHVDAKNDAFDKAYKSNNNYNIA